MKAGDIVKYRYGHEDPVLLLAWWEFEGDEERLDETYWRVLIDGKTRTIKERHLVVMNESR